MSILLKVLTYVDGAKREGWEGWYGIREESKLEEEEEGGGAEMAWAGERGVKSENEV